MQAQSRDHFLSPACMHSQRENGICQVIPRSNCIEHLSRPYRRFRIFATIVRILIYAQDKGHSANDGRPNPRGHSVGSPAPDSECAAAAAPGAHYPPAAAAAAGRRALLPIEASFIGLSLSRWRQAQGLLQRPQGPRSSVTRTPPACHCGDGLSDNFNFFKLNAFTFPKELLKRLSHRIGCYIAQNGYSTKVVYSQKKCYIAVTQGSRCRK